MAIINHSSIKSNLITMKLMNKELLECTMKKLIETIKKSKKGFYNNRQKKKNNKNSRILIKIQHIKTLPSMVR